jgi:hypothetical protein
MRTSWSQKIRGKLSALPWPKGLGLCDELEVVMGRKSLLTMAGLHMRMLMYDMKAQNKLDLVLHTSLGHIQLANDETAQNLGIHPSHKQAHTPMYLIRYLRRSSPT